MNNPFTLTFGKLPIEAIGRPVQKNEITESFSAEPANQQVYVITGVRGSGKTVLMTDVENTFRQNKDWIVVELNPETDLLQSLAAKLQSVNYCAELFKKAKLNLSFLGLGMEIDGVPQITDTETAITRMLEILKKKGKKVLIAIDEAGNTPQMRVFANSFQMFVRGDLPVFLLITGLYENIETLQNANNLTFLYRAPKVELKPLNLSAISARYERILGINPGQAKEMAVLTRGYPFAFQVLGYLTWNAGGDYPSVMEEYRHYMSDYVYDKIWSELSPKDKAICLAIALTPSGSVKEIRERIPLSTNEFNPYRKRLLKKGIISGDERGKVSFRLPLFEEYVKDSIFELAQ